LTTALNFVQTVKDSFSNLWIQSHPLQPDGQTGLEMSLTHQPALNFGSTELPGMTGFGRINPVT